MTYKDAAVMIDRILDEDRHLYTERAVNALEMGKDALLKLEPTPCVKKEGSGKYVCPTCGMAIYIPYFTDNCPVCGQRLTPYNKDIGDMDGD